MSENTWTYCMRIERTDGVVVGLTELDEDLVYNGETYEAANAYSQSAMDNTCSLSVNNANAEGMLVITGVNADDLRDGLFDGAAVQFYIIDFSNLSSATLVRTLGTGFLGDATITTSGYSIEYRSLAQKLQQPVGRKYLAECDARLGDSRCGVDIGSLTVSGTVTSVTDTQTFTDSGLAQAAGYFNYGLVTWTSGANNGLSMEVKSFTSGQIVLLFPMAYDIAVSDTFTVYPGCDKRKSTCISKFNNVINFRGFDDIPGQDEVLSTGS